MNPEGSITAKLCAFARAYHSEHAASKIVDDYLAHDLMGQREYDAMESLIASLSGSLQCPAGMPCETGEPEFCPLLRAYLAPIPLSRLAYTESRLASFAATYKHVQYVICGAGLDTYSFRNENANVRVFEVDHPITQAYKIDRARGIKAKLPANTRYLPVDFTQGDLTDALSAAGFDAQTPTFFAIPGVSYYLPHTVFDQLIASISRAMPASSVLMFDYPTEDAESTSAQSRLCHLAAVTAQLGEPMAPRYTHSEIAAILQHHRLAVQEHLAPSDIQTAYFSDRDDGQTAYENVHFILAA